MRLAGLELNDAYPIDRKQPLAESVKSTAGISDGATQHDGSEPATDLSWDDSESYAREWLKFALSRFLLSGSFIIVAGCVLA